LATFGPFFPNEPVDSSLPFFFLVSNWLKFAAQKKGPAHFAEFGQISNLLILFVFLFSFS
jgi:hypothetical protein